MSPDAPRRPSDEDWRGAAEQGAATREAASAAAHGPGVPGWAPASAGIPAQLLEEIVAWSQAGVPNEACGLLAGPTTAEDGGVPTRFIGMRNAAASPYRYLMDPDEQLRVMLDMDDRDEIVWGIVHSHVASKAEPSATDVGLAFYPDALYLVCSLADATPLVRAWSIRDGSVGEVVLEIG